MLIVDGKEVVRQSMEHTTPVTFLDDETFHIGSVERRTVVAGSHSARDPDGPSDPAGIQRTGEENVDEATE